MVTEPNPSVSIERDQLYYQSMLQSGGEPMVVRQAKAMAHVLRNMDVEIFQDELIVGKIVKRIPGAIVYPETTDGVLYELAGLKNREPRPFEITEEDIKILTGDIRDYWAEHNLRAHFKKHRPEVIGDILGTGAIFNSSELSGAGHIIINYPMIISKGFRKIGVMAESKINELSKTSDEESMEKIAFYQAEKILCEAIIHFARRYSTEAEKLAKLLPDSKRKDELEAIAEICKNVPANPPRNFHEGLQFIRFTHLVLTLETRSGASISMGRIDQYLYPFYERDIQAGVLDQERAKELIEFLWIKTNESLPLVTKVVVPYIRGLLTTQSVTIGGFDGSGKDVSNELTLLILKATRDIALPLPNVHVRVSNESPPEFLEELAKTIASGTNTVSIFNDEIATESWIRKGIPLEEARDYAVIGCVELAPNGTSFTSAGAAAMNLAIYLEMALNRGKSTILGKTFGPDTGDPAEFKSIDEVIEAFKTQLSYFVALMAESSMLCEKTNIELKPTPFLSLCVEDCFEVGKDITRGSARYNFTGVQGIGMADVGDSLAAIDELVFKQKLVSMRDLVDAIHNDFSESEPLRQMLLNKSPKYGNDNETADRFTQEVARIFSEELEKPKNIRGGDFIAGMLSVTVHEPYGWFTGALPSGRKATSILSNGVSPVIASPTKGLTPILQSVSKIDYKLYPNGVAFTVGLDPGILSGETGSDVLSSMIKSYFEMGGMQIQFNLIDTAKLLDAQKNPEAYRNLLVRVAGFSAYFVDLSKGLQDEVIGRFQRGQSF